MRRFPAAIGGFTLLVALTACSSGSDTPDRDPPSEVRVGLLVEQADAIGQDAVRGAELAADMINRGVADLALPLTDGQGLPHLGGAEVVIVTADTTGGPGAAAAQVATLESRENPAGLVMVGQAATTAAASQRSERLGLPFLDAYGTANYLTTRGLDWFFRLGPTDRMLGEELFSLLRSREIAGDPVRRLGFVHDGDPLSRTTTQAITELATEAGYTVAGEIRADPAASGDTLGDEMADRDPDVVVAVSHDPVVAAMLAESLAPATGELPVVGLGRGFTDLPVTTAIESLLSARPWSAEFSGRHPTAVQVATRYAELFGAMMSEAAASAFTAILTLALAIDGAESTDAAEIRSALLSLQLSGVQTIMPWEGIRFSSSGQNTGAAGVVEQVIGGRLVMVYPTELSRSTVVWPAPGSADA